MVEVGMVATNVNRSVNVGYLKDRSFIYSELLILQSLIPILFSFFPSPDQVLYAYVSIKPVVIK